MKHCCASVGQHRDADIEKTPATERHADLLNIGDSGEKGGGVIWVGRGMTEGIAPVRGIKRISQCDHSCARANNRRSVRSGTPPIARRARRVSRIAIRIR